MSPRGTASPVLMEVARGSLADHFKGLLHESQVPSFFLSFSIFREVDMLIFVVMAEMFFGSDDFLGFPGNLRGGCYSSLGHFPTPPPQEVPRKVTLSP